MQLVLTENDYFSLKMTSEKLANKEDVPAQKYGSPYKGVGSGPGNVAKRINLAKNQVECTILHNYWRVLDVQLKSQKAKLR